MCEICSSPKLRTTQRKPFVNPRLAWKVIGLDKTSACAREKDMVTYKVGQWTKPNKGSCPFLFVFSTREKARNFSRMLIDRKVWRCEIKNPTTARKTQHKEYAGELFDSSNPTFPSGTLFVDAVKLVKQDS